jgi:hypothetical protein
MLAAEMKYPLSSFHFFSQHFAAGVIAQQSNPCGKGSNPTTLKEIVC